MAGSSRSTDEEGLGCTRCHHQHGKMSLVSFCWQAFALRNCLVVLELRSHQARAQRMRPLRLVRYKRTDSSLDVAAAQKRQRPSPRAPDSISNALSS